LVGRNPVREALQRGEGDLQKVFLQRGAKGHHIREILTLATSAGVPVQYVPPQKLKWMAGAARHQGVIAIAAPIAYMEVEEMLNEIASNIDVVRAREPIVLVLDGIEDPHNFGAILRSAVAAGVEGVIVPKHNMAPLNAAALKASAGMGLRLPIARVGNMTETVIQLKERGYWVAGGVGEGAISIWEMDWDRPLALVIGNEQRGIRPLVAKACDYLVAIPMRGPAESLNASVATGVFLFVASRNRPPLN